MERAVHLLERRVPQPQRIPYKDSFIYRYVEKSLHQALVQKLARLVTGLHAARLLMESGFVQEQAALQRMIDEAQEDITFLAFSVIFDEVTPHHKIYLDAFYEDEFDAKSVAHSKQKRAMVPRDKIRAYIARMGGDINGSSRAVDVSRTLSKAYSGYVHAASPQIMDMYGGNPPKFHVRGVRGTEKQEEYRADIWNYFYRCVIAFGFAAKAFGDEVLFQEFLALMQEFERKSGKEYSSQE